MLSFAIYSCFVCEIFRRFTILPSKHFHYSDDVYCLFFRFFGFSYAVCNIYAAFGCKINFLLGRKKAACAKYIVGAAFIANMFVNVNDMYALLIYALLHIHTSEEKKSPKFDAPRNIQHGTNDGNGMRMWIRATASKCQKLTDLYEIKMRERVRQQQQ